MTQLVPRPPDTSKTLSPGSSTPATARGYKRLRLADAIVLDPQGLVSSLTELDGKISIVLDRTKAANTANVQACLLWPEKDLLGNDIPVGQFTSPTNQTIVKVITPPTSTSNTIIGMATVSGPDFTSFWAGNAALYAIAGGPTMRRFANWTTADNAQALGCDKFTSSFVHSPGATGKTYTLIAVGGYLNAADNYISRFALTIAMTLSRAPHLALCFGGSTVGVGTESITVEAGYLPTIPQDSLVLR